jgi:serine/threonine protein kinase
MTPTHVNREEFFRTLKQSGLLSRRNFRHAVERLADLPRPRAIARVLVDWGLISKFQAELLLIGRAKGFFLGPYKILDQLGQGGMGRVYKALHQTMNRTVALKVLAPHLVKTPKAHKLFLREVQAAAQLNHPNIVTAYDANEIGGRHYLAMEFVDGPNLEQLVREQGALPVGMACEIVRQIADGLQHAHDHGMIHRDIKPANLLLQPSKNLQSFVVKILDFGLARLGEPGAQDTTGTIEVRENIVMGTPDFLSPEQARNLHKLDIRSDIYSLGCSFYYLLTGKVPFPGGTTLEKLIRQSSEEPRPVEESRQDVPAAVLSVLQRAMAKQPEERFQTPQEFAVALVPHAVACAPTWDDQARRASASLNANTPPNKGDDQAPKPPSAEISTLPQGLPHTTLANSEDPFLPGTEDDHRRQARKALLRALGIVILLTATVATVILLNQP